MTKLLLPAALLFTSVVGITSCADSTPPPVPGPRGRNLDAPPRYGVGEEQTRYFEGTNTPPPPGDPNAAANIQAPDPNAPTTGSTVTPPGSTSATTAVTPPPPTVVTPPTPAPAPAPANIPFATRVPSKPGFVKSPFDPNGQEIDVRDFQSGQKARCPYTGKIFRVP